MSANCFSTQMKIHGTAILYIRRCHECDEYPCTGYRCVRWWEKISEGLVKIGPETKKLPLKNNWVPLCGCKNTNDGIKFVLYSSNDLRLQKHRTKYDLRKYFFTNRALDVWNSLPNHVVLCDTVNTFKSKLDKFWQQQPIIYDFKAEILGTGSRSWY